MTKNIRLLSLLFAAQLVVLGLVYLSTRPQLDEQRPLVNTSLSDADEVQIVDGDNTLSLKLDDQQWIIQDYGQLPAAESKVSELIDDLKEINIQWPVASSDSAAERFEVSADSAKKTLKFLSQSKELFSLYIGTSPGYRKQHVSLDGKEVYSVELAEHRISANKADWLNKDLLKIESTITAAQFADVSLAISDESWSVDGLNTDESANADSIQRWVDRFGNLQVSNYLAAKEAEKITITDPSFKVRLTTDNSETGFNFYTQNEKFYVKQFDNENLFEIAAYQAEPITEVTRESFVSKQTEETPPDENQN